MHKQLDAERLKAATPADNATRVRWIFFTALLRTGIQRSDIYVQECCRTVELEVGGDGPAGDSKVGCCGLRLECLMLSMFKVF